MGYEYQYFCTKLVVCSDLSNFVVYYSEGPMPTLSTVLA